MKLVQYLSSIWLGIALPLIADLDFTNPKFYAFLLPLAFFRYLEDTFKEDKQKNNTK